MKNGPDEKEATLREAGRNAQQSNQAGPGGPTLGVDPLAPPAFWRFAAVAVFLAVIAAPFDLTISNAARASDATILSWMVLITDVGRNFWYLTPAGVLLVLALVGLRTRDEPRERTILRAIAGQAGFVIATVGGATIITTILKAVIGRARPTLAEQFGAYHFQPFTFDDLFYSLPSGHATNIGAVTMILILWFPRVAWPLFVVGVFLAATRVAALAHRPSDVIAGFSIGIGTTLMVARYLASRELFFRRSPGKMLPEMIAPTPRK